MSWVETQSLSFSARHEAADADAAGDLLAQLERFRIRMADRFPQTPGEVAVVIHARPLMLALAHPWLPLARQAAAPAARRYMAGWFASGEIHVLGPDALRRRASAVPGSLEALKLTPQHEYAHLVLAANNPQLPPPFTPRSFGHYLRWAWLCEGAATFFSGQAPHLRAAVVRRLREGAAPSFPPSARDAPLLGASVFELLERGAGIEACIALASSREPDAASALARAFARPAAEVEADWREHLRAI